MSTPPRALRAVSGGDTPHQHVSPGTTDKYRAVELVTLRAVTGRQAILFVPLGAHHPDRQLPMRFFTNIQPMAAGQLVLTFNCVGPDGLPYEGNVIHPPGEEAYTIFLPAN